MSSTRWTAEHVVDGQLLFRIGRDGDDLVAEWPGLCELRSDRQGEKVAFVAAEDADARVVAKVRAGLGAALIRHLRGETSLHASAFSRDGRSFACLGPSGAGKSTLAAWMCSRRGHALLADDIVRVRIASDRAYAEPTEKEHWLDARSRAALGLPPPVDVDKAPAEAPTTATMEGPLVALVSLAYGSAKSVSLRPVHGHRALALLVPCLVRFVIDEPDAQVAELARIDALLARAPLYELSAPRALDALPAVADALETLR